jgi:DNA processing protein
VGTRTATKYGKQVAYDLAATCNANGIVVVSGGARGIDTAAHQGCESQNMTIVVFGCGLQKYFPAANGQLFKRIAAEGGLLLSEFPFTMPALSYNFPRRNRLISGLCEKVVICQAGPKSGALITAHFALEQGREVWVVPSRIDDDSFTGSMQLLQQGANILIEYRDVLPPDSCSKPVPKIEAKQADIRQNFSAIEQQIIALIEKEQLNQEELLLRLSQPAAEAITNITKLELAGVLAPDGQGNYILV